MPTELASGASRLATDMLDFDNKSGKRKRESPTVASTDEHCTGCGPCRRSAYFHSVMVQLLEPAHIQCTTAQEEIVSAAAICNWLK